MGIFHCCVCWPEGISNFAIHCAKTKPWTQQLSNLDAMSLLAENQDCPAFIKKLLKQRINTLEPAWAEHIQHSDVFFQNWIWYINTNNNNVHNIIIPNPCVFEPHIFADASCDSKSTWRHLTAETSSHACPKRKPPNLTVAGVGESTKNYLQKHLFEEYFWKMQRKKMEKCSNKS